MILLGYWLRGRRRRAKQRAREARINEMQQNPTFEPVVPDDITMSKGQQSAYPAVMQQMRNNRRNRQPQDLNRSF